MSILAFMEFGKAVNRATPIAGSDNTLVLTAMLAAAVLLLASIRYRRRLSALPAR